MMPTTSDKPQTLAEQIRAMEPPNEFSDDTFDSGWFYALEVAAQLAGRPAAIADTAATTTPAEQAGDVGQAWRVKPLVWHNFDAWTWWAESTSGTYRVEERNGVWRATLNLPSIEHVIYEYETDCAPNDFEAAHLACQADHTARITAALEPDPTPALGWRAMQTAAAEAVAKEAHGETVLGGQRFKTVKLEDAVDAILALPGPTDEQALAEALRLREVQELVAAVKRLNNACDAMWNDHKRLEKNSGSFGQPYQIKEMHIKAISEAQQALPDALAKIETVRGQGYRLSEALSAHVHPSTRNKASGTPWSPKEDKILREMKTSWSELWTIAEELERSERAIIERLRILEC